MDSEFLIGLVQERFAAVLQRLAKGEPPHPVGAMSAASKVIHQQASRQWSVRLDVEVSVFRFSTAQTTLYLRRDKFGEVLQGIFFAILQEEDTQFKEILHKLALEDWRPLIMDIFLALFVGHEFFHVEQQLGSDQYRDSDSYMSVVSTLDYQADLASLWYLLHRVSPFVPLGPKEYFYLLLTVHIATIHGFRESEDIFERETFDRLLVWYFQLARVIRSERGPDITHPSVQNMPVISIPALKQFPLRLSNFEDDWRNGPTERQDLVVAICDGFGIQRALRMASTDKYRVKKLCHGILSAKTGEVRDQLEELFLVYSPTLDFLPGNLLVQNLSALCALADQLTVADPERIIGRYDIDVVSFFERAEQIIKDTRPPLYGEGLDEYRALWKRGSSTVIDDLLVQRVTKGWQRSQHGTRVSSVLKGEILRVGIRLASALDVLLDQRATSAP
ncbi:MAG: hypothetical protein JWO81_722, partial [Alphaproteobacteria bacterium]|nr:hypothetical protein [Alphaproteobacteria bacterium]